MTDASFLNEIRWAMVQFIVLILCVSLHEFGHAWMADKRGDPLPRAQGRVTLNPLSHIDPIGTLAIPALMIFLPLFWGGMPALIGWGKPVQISLSNAKTRRADDIFTTLAGPGMNFFLALVGSVAMGLIYAFGGDGVPATIYAFLGMFVMMNASLGVFNLIPLPPLDGSRVLRYAVGMSEETFLKIARNAWWILLLAINLPPGNPIFLVIFKPIIFAVYSVFFGISDFVASIF